MKEFIRIYRYIYTYKNEGEWGGAYGRVWRKKTQGRNVAIELSSQKLKK